MSEFDLSNTNWNGRPRSGEPIVMTTWGFDLLPLIPCAADKSMRMSGEYMTGHSRQIDALAPALLRERGPGASGTWSKIPRFPPFLDVRLQFKHPHIHGTSHFIYPNQ